MKTETDRIPTAPQRQEMIAIAAYYLAEQRDFAPGGADADWLRAEQLIDAMIADRRIGRATEPEARRASIRNALQLT
ncbi:Protein of unknown function (DUF2934) [Thiocystis violascens DSM 198]|uniref:DUF2934 domain-containing protein n=2 Tax=Thiocystis violascens TaxID=73141 RepID=I3YDT5_THIV6|nr:Protein of unknown function (DUF2934) [Thiocystis violascens DSM 198]